MKDLLKRVFDAECGGVVINNQFIASLTTYMNRLIYKNDEHTRFFGGILIGVERVKFLDSDRNDWFFDILKQDEYVLTDAIKERAGTVSSIREQWEVSGDTMNLSCVWLCEKIYSSSLSQKLKDEGMIAVLFVLQFKFFTSRLNQHFKYPLSPTVAEAIVKNMSMRYDVKQAGTWLGYFMQRCDTYLQPTWKYRDVIRKMDEDEDVVQMLNAVQGTIRETLKDIYRIFLVVKDQKQSIYIKGNMIEHDGEEALRDLSHGHNSYKTYLLSIAGDQTNFIKAELIDVICGLMANVSPKHLEMTLIWLSSNANLGSSKEIRQFLEDTLVHAFNYLGDSDNRVVMKNTSDLPGMLAALRGAYMSSRSTDQMLLKLRDRCERYAKKATGNKSEAVLAGIRTATLLYVVLRTMTKRHYTS